MTRSFTAILLLLGSIPPIARAAQPPRAAELLERSIRYHDPEGLWMKTVHCLDLEETRPNGPARRTTIVIDNHTGRFEMTRETDGAPKIELRVEGEVVEAELDGSPEFSDDDAEKYRLTPEAAKRTRNYYTFLYGLPMKLRDPGTRLDPEARRTKFQGKDVLALRVTYDETVGGDIWYFYLDPDSHALVGYRFYHDEGANDGEYITLEDEARVGTIRLPRVRTWYTNDAAKLLGTDAIKTIKEASSSEFAELVTGYIEAWKLFYPSRAYSRGFLTSIHGIENYSTTAIRAWIDFNRRTLEEINETRENLTRDEAIDARLIAAKIRSELEKWQMDRPHETSLALYADPIARAIPRVAESPLLSPEEKLRAIRRQLDGIDALSAAAEKSLRDGRKQTMGKNLKRLEAAAVYLERDLPEVVRPWLGNGSWKELTRKCQGTSIRVRQLARHVIGELLPNLTLPADPILGRDNFTRKLNLYTDSNLTPGELEAMALDEIEDSKHAIHELSAAYLRETYPHLELPSDLNSLVARAFEDLEKNRPSSEQEYLQKLRRFGQEAEDFVREHEIATLPERQTLSIELAPESSGPMARIGYVRSAPPFHPNPWTVWYLATIPDSHPEREREEFWRSFNYSFKKFIVIHELFPGHYLQNKILRENLHPVRILFPYGPYSEGWATLAERVALDAGYAADDKLTLLAQLRKRLENANRAYMSVQVHCNGWDQEQVNRVSIEVSLLAPQFAKSLWGRLMRSPLQMTSYMLGSLMFTEVYGTERKRLGPNFQALHFMDTILRTGPVPIDELPSIFENSDDGL